MYISASQRRLSAVVIIACLVIAAAIVVRARQHSSATTAITTATTDSIMVAPTRTPIPITDKNGDGIPDWQEALVETSQGGVAVPTTTDQTATGTLTDQFSQKLLQSIVESKTSGGFGQTPQQIVTDASTQLAQQAQDTLLTQKDITISNDNSPAALAAYGTAVATIMTTYSQSSDNEALILQGAIQANDPSKLKQLDKNIQAYTDYLNYTKALPVPSSVATEDVNLLNAYQAILNDTKAMQNVFNDPMLALLRLKRYQDDAAGLYYALTGLYTTLIQHGATWDPNSVVYTIISTQNPGQ